MRESSEANPQPKKDSKWIHDWVCVKIGYPHAISVFFPDSQFPSFFLMLGQQETTTFILMVGIPPFMVKLGMVNIALLRFTNIVKFGMTWVPIHHFKPKDSGWNSSSAQQRDETHNN